MTLEASLIADLPIRCATCALRGKENSSRFLRLFQAHRRSRAASIPGSASFRKQRVRAARAVPSPSRCATESLSPSRCVQDRASAGVLSGSQRNRAGLLPSDSDESLGLDLPAAPGG